MTQNSFTVSRRRYRRRKSIFLAALILFSVPFAMRSAVGDFATESIGTSKSTAPDVMATGRMLGGLFGASPKLPNVARISVKAPDSLAHGSGTLIGVKDQHGFVLTNWHVVRDATDDNVFVDFPDGFRSAATVIKTDDTWDLALLLVWRPNVAPMPLAPAAPGEGQPLIIAGYGQGSFRTQQGRLTDFASPTETAPLDMIEISAEARQGDSGGPMINEQGELAGVLFGAGGGRTTGTHVNRVRQFLDSAFQRSPPTHAEAIVTDDEMEADRILAQAGSTDRQLTSQVSPQGNTGRTAATIPADGSFGTAHPFSTTGPRPGPGPGPTPQQSSQVVVRGVQPVELTDDERLQALRAETMQALQNVPMIEQHHWNANPSASATPIPSQFSAGAQHPLNELIPFFGVLGFLAVVFLFLPR